MSDATPLTADEILAAQMAASFEGFSATAYLDTLAKPPVWTVGFGSIWLDDGSPVPQGYTVTRDQAVEMMAREMRKAMVDLCQVCHVPLNTQMMAALEDFIYNLGVGNFNSSTLLRKINAKDWEGAAQEFEKWDHAGGVEIAGLLRRRKAEEALFDQGVAQLGTADPTTPIAPATTTDQQSLLDRVVHGVSDLLG